MTTIINDPTLKLLIEHYGGISTWHNLNKNKNDLGYGLLHYSLIRLLKPRRILAVGSKYGFIPACLAIACKDNNKGKVDFVDAGFDKKNPRAWSGVGFWKKVDFKKHFSVLNLDNWINFYLMTTTVFSKKNPAKTWQYIYVDGDHTYEGVKKDFNFFWPKLEQNSFMVFHDIVGLEGTKKFWKYLKKNHHSMICLPGKFGLGIVQKSKQQNNIISSIFHFK